MSAKPQPVNLAELQSRLFSLITARGCVGEELVASGLAASHVTECILGDEKLDAVGRLDIYNGMYFLRLLQDVLQVDYPTSCAVLGETRFRDLVGDYLQACRPNRPSARDASERLPGFLEHWALGNQVVSWLPALAALEWSRVDVFDERDDETLTMSRLQTIAPSDLPDLHLAAVHAHRLVRSTHDIALVWRAVDQARPVPEPNNTPQLLVVWRQDGVVYHRTADDDEQDLLPLLATGLSFGQMCERLGERYDEAIAAHTAVRLLSLWVQDGLLRAA